MRFLISLTLVFAFFAMTAATAFADNNDDGALCDCPPDYICEAEVVYRCERDGGVPCPSNDPNCNSEPSEPECHEETVTRCTPPECESDADCASGTICVEYVYEMCSGSGSTCAVPEPGESETCESESTMECEISSEQYCVPPYLAPCDEDADCGDGFTCTFSSAPVCVESSDPNEESFCDTDDDANDGPGRCSLDYVSCETDADCTNDFVCHAGGQMDCAVEPGFDFEEGEDDPVDTDPVDSCEAASSGYCGPEYFYASHDSRPGSGDSEGIYGESPASSEDSELLDSSPVGNRNQDGDSDSSGSSSSSGSAGGCSTAPATGGTPFLLVIALIAGAIGIRRR